MMTATQCPSHQRLHAYSCGRLPDDDSQAVYEHLQDCHDCQSELNAVDDADDSLIVDLRADDQYAGFSDEPECRRALAKALGALARADDKDGSILPAMDLPAHLGEYEIVREIGHGGMGRVFLARHTKLGREVALKVIADHRLTDPKTRDRFDAEMRAVGRLSHPNIVTAHDAREVDGLAVLVTEFIDGKNLQQIVTQTGPLSLANAADVIIKVAAALQYTSDQGFVHRDVKPSNIMISRSGEVKLLDLGLARFHTSSAAELTASGQTIGTADYVSPEQIANAHDADSRSDVYSLGCTLFKLLTGLAPFESEQYATSFGKLTAHVSVPPPSLKKQLPGCPNEIVKLVEAMLEKSPDRRPQTSGEVAKLLSRHVNGSDLEELVRRADESLPSTRPLPQSNPPATQPWLRRPVPRSLAIACGLFGILVGLMLGTFIKIKYPDGTEVTLPLTPGTKVEVVSDEVGRESVPAAEMSREVTKPNMAAGIQEDLSKVNPSQLIIDQLQGIWQLKSTWDNEQTVLAYFDVYDFCVVTVGEDRKEISFGSIATQVDGFGVGSIHLNFFPRDLQVELKLSAPSKIGKTFKVVTTPYRSDSDFLGLTKNQAGRGSELTFERVGSFPVTPMNLDALLGDHKYEANDPFVKALSILTQAHIGPEQMHEILSKANAANQIVQSINNLKQIGLAFHNFHSRFDHFPGSKNAMTENVALKTKVAHPFSWRVAILPYINQQELYDSYQFSEPWDSVTNLALLGKMPDIYRSPRAPAHQPKGITNYVGITNKDALMEKEGGRNMSEIADGTANTILVVESQKTVPWTAPEDLSEYPEFFSPAIYVMADGSVHSNDDPDRFQLHKMSTIDGGEKP